MSAASYVERAFRFVSRLLPTDLSGYGALDTTTRHLSASFDQNLAGLQPCLEAFGRLMHKYPPFRFDPSVNGGRPYSIGDFFSKREFIGITTTAELYDEPTLLGTEIGVGSQCCNQAFIAAGSAYTLNNPTTVDFTTILNDKIHGRIDISVTGGSLSQYEITSADLLLGHGSGPVGFPSTAGASR